jgi:hypothetical protein
VPERFVPNEIMCGQGGCRTLQSLGRLAGRLG